MLVRESGCSSDVALIELDLSYFCGQNEPVHFETKFILFAGENRRIILDSVRSIESIQVLQIVLRYDKYLGIFRRYIFFGDPNYQNRKKRKPTLCVKFGNKFRFY